MSELRIGTAEPQRRVGWTPRRRVLVGVAAISLLAAGCSANKGDTTEGPTSGAPIATSAGPTDERTSLPAAAPSPKAKTYLERADNHAGSPVFEDNRGTAVRDGEPSRIPYGTVVHVRCFEKNESGMDSVNGLYVIEGGPWNEDRVVASTMDNNAGMGPTNNVDRDPRVSDCPPIVAATPSSFTLPQEYTSLQLRAA